MVKQTETRITDPETGGSKNSKQEMLGAIDPKSLRALGQVAAFGTVKYDRMNFMRGYAWSLSFDAMQRHAMAFWEGEDLDPDTGLSHMAHVAWHAMAMCTFYLRELGTDDRYKDPR